MASMTGFELKTPFCRKRLIYHLTNHLLFQKRFVLKSTNGWMDSNCRFLVSKATGFKKTCLPSFFTIYVP